MPSIRTYRYFGLILASSLWLGIIFLAPLLRSWESSFSGFVYLFFSSICHQETERCFSLAGYPLGVCARCTGLYLGFWIGLIVLPHWRFLSYRLAEKPRIVLLFMLPMAVDVLLPGINTHWSRLISGVLASFPVSIFVWWGISQIGHQVFRRSPS